MKARLIEYNGTLQLLLCTGIVRTLDLPAAKEFIFHYDNPHYYAGPGVWDYEGISMENYNGETIAFVGDTGILHIVNPKQFRNILLFEPAKLLTVPEFAQLHGKKPSIVRRYCLEGRIKGAIQKGTRWLIPADCPYPTEE